MNWELNTPYYPNSFPTEDRGVDWGYIFRRDVERSIEIPVYYLGGAAEVFEDIFDIPYGNFDGDEHCIIVRHLYALKVIIRKT